MATKFSDASPTSHASLASGDRRSRVLRGMLFLLVSTILVLGTAALLFFAGWVSFGESLWMAVTQWVPYLLPAPLVFRVARRFPLMPGRWLRNLAVHLVGGLVFALVAEALHAAVMISDLAPARPIPPWLRANPPLDLPALPEGSPFAPPDPPPGFPPSARAQIPPFRPPPGLDHPLALMRPLVFKLPLAVSFYGIIVSVAHILSYLRRLGEQDRRAAQLEANMVQARLEALQLQLQPHFLFNTLNSISALIFENPRQADKMLENLADLLRMTLQKRGEPESSLQEELAVLESYLAIQRVRFGEHLVFELEVDPTVANALVPSLILQPLVENAIEHGFGADREAGRIRIEARRQGDRVSIRVQDDGRGVTAHCLPRSDRGVGLSNTRARLATLYGDQYRFSCNSPWSGGFVVELGFPHRPQKNQGEERQP